MTNLKLTSKTAIAAMCSLAVVFLCGGCDDTVKGYTLNYGEGSGWNRRSVVIACDSFQMVTPKQCIFWKDGKKGNIIATETILVNNVLW